MDEDHNGLARRTLLAGVGAGVGLVWVTPVVIRVDAAGASASQEPEEPEPEGELEPEPAVLSDVRQPGGGSDRLEVEGGLAHTGSDAILPLVEGGAALVAGGALLGLAARRRRLGRTATWRLLRRRARRASPVVGPEADAPGSRVTR